MLKNHTQKRGFRRGRKGVWRVKKFGPPSSHVRARYSFLYPARTTGLAEDAGLPPVFLHPVQKLLLLGLTMGVELVPGQRGRTTHGQGGDDEKKQDGERAGPGKRVHGQPAL